MWPQCAATGVWQQDHWHAAVPVLYHYVYDQLRGLACLPAGNQVPSVPQGHRLILAIISPAGAAVDILHTRLYITAVLTRA
jgi:hypothetical protein